MVMIGAGPGVMALAVLEGLEHSGASLTVIDNDTTQWVEAHVRETGLEGRAKISYVVSDSSHYGREMWPKGNRLRLLIVDGDHSERGVRDDIMAWCPKVEERSLVFFHEYEDCTGPKFEKDGSYISEVRPVVEATMRGPNWKEVANLGCSIMFEKTA